MKQSKIFVQWALFFIFNGLLFSLSAQQDTIAAPHDTLLLTKNFKFTDGIYLSFESFQANQPDYALSELKAELYTNPQNFMTQVQQIMVPVEEGFDTLSIEKVWGLSIAGIPYVRLPKGAVDKETWVFAGLQLRGKICYFSFEDEYEREMIMAAYNPLTGRPFRQGIVKRSQKVTFEKMLHFETGEIEDFTLSGFKEWIKDDQKLLASVNDLTPNEVQKKLFKCMLIYVDRNKVYLKP